MLHPKTAEEYESLIDILKDLTDVACAKGTADYDMYLHGMANGMIFALALMQDENPEYIEAPDMFIADREILNKLEKSGVQILTPSKK